ncbi:MAG: LuxR C-terminal-related transcriptional regulator, partial [Thermomicrobiales bacterium]
ERSLEMAPNAPIVSRARAHIGGAMMTHWQGDDTQAELWVRHGIELAEEAGDEWAAAFGWGILGLVAEDSGRYEDAVAPLERALEIADRLAFPATIGLVLDHLGVVAWGRGNPAGAVEYWNRGLAVHRAVEDEWGAAIALSYLGIAACERGDLATALDMQRESLTYRWDIRNTEDVAHGLANLAMIAVAGGHPQQAARLFAASESTHELIGNPVKEPERSIYQKYIDRTRIALGEDLFRETWAVGRMLPLDIAVAEALTPFEIRADAEERPFGLTAREMDVLRLMVEGQTDKDIADQLFISTRTAQGHVSHILGKMSVPSRTAATSLAIREGITSAADRKP